MADEEKKKKKKKKSKEDEALDGDKDEKKKKKKKKNGEESEATTTGESEQEEKKKKKKSKKKDSDGDNEAGPPEVSVTDAPAEPPIEQTPNLLTPRPDPSRTATRASHGSRASHISQDRNPSRTSQPIMPPIDRRASMAPSDNRRPSLLPPDNRRQSMAPSLGSQLLPSLKAGTQMSLLTQAQSAAPPAPAEEAAGGSWWDKEWEAAPRRVIPPVSKDTWAKMELLNKKLMTEPKQVKFEEEALPDKVDLTLEFYTDGQEQEKEQERDKKGKKGKKGKDKDKSDRDTDRDTDKEKKKKKDKKSKKDDDESTDDERDTDKEKKKKKDKKSNKDDSEQTDDERPSKKSKKKAKSASDAEEYRPRRESVRPLSERQTTGLESEEEDVDAIDFDPVDVVDPRMARIMARLSDARADPTESQLVDPIFPAKCECCSDRNNYTRGIIRDETVVARPHFIQKTIEDGMMVRRRDNGLGFYRSDSRVLIPVSNYVEKHLSTEMMNAGYSHEEARKMEAIRTKASQSIPPNLIEWPYYPNGPALAQELERFVSNDAPSGGNDFVLSENVNDSNTKLDDAMRRLKKSISRF